MAGQVCYIKRTDRGARLVSARLLGAHADSAWHATLSADPAQEPAEAARWIRERLSGSGPRRLDALYVDVDGAVCTWVSAPGGDPSAARAAALSAPDDDTDDDEWSSPEHSEAVSRFPSGGSLELAVEPLTKPGTGKTQKKRKPSTGGSDAARVGVISAPDLALRLLVDALDANGVRVERTATLWHAIVDAWASPRGGSGDAEYGRDGLGPRAERVVADAVPATAIVLVADDESRLVWAWAREGDLIAAGSQRVAHTDTSEEAHAAVAADDIGVLASDWLGWSAQLGTVPGRIVCVGPAGEPGTAGPRQVSAWLSKRWPNATADAIEVEDPVAETLRRALAGGVPAERAGRLSDIGARGGRAQRIAHIWVAGAAIVIAGLLAFIAWSIWSRGSAWNDKLAEYQSQRTQIVQQHTDVIANAGMAVPELEGAVRSARERLRPIDTGAAPKPVLEEFETLTLVLAGDGIDLRELDVTAAGVSAKVFVEDIASYERLTIALDSVAGSKIDWREPSTRQIGGRIEVNYTGLWNAEALRPAPAGGSQP